MIREHAVVVVQMRREREQEGSSYETETEKEMKEQLSEEPQNSMILASILRFVWMRVPHQGH